MKLCIISHTEHYKNSNGKIVGWGPTVNEINHLTEVFDEIYHIAMLQEGTVPKSAVAYTSNKIKFIALPALGGKTIFSKIKIIVHAPKVIAVVSKTLKKVDCFQLRTPTGIGVFLIPYLTFFTKKRGWYKYAGNWNQKNPPLGYAIQRSMLKRQKRIVTINGKWTNQPEHCLTFENPCLAQEDIHEGKAIIKKKDFTNKLTFCFVGRLERDKGVERIIKGFLGLGTHEKSKVEAIHFVGEGPESKYFKDLASESDLPMIFHGALPRNKVFNIYKKSHLFLLPSSASEGFPKVIAEAMNFGCIPIVSSVSSIEQYVKDKYNGYIVSPNTVEEMTNVLSYAISDNGKTNLIQEEKSISKLFSFDYYNKRIEHLIKED